MSFAKNMDKSIGKNISKDLSSKYSEKLLDHETDALKTSSKGVIQKTTKTAREVCGNKIANIITKVSKNSQQNI